MHALTSNGALGATPIRTTIVCSMRWLRSRLRPSTTQAELPTVVEHATRRQSFICNLLPVSKLGPDSQATAAGEPVSRTADEGLKVSLRVNLPIDACADECLLDHAHRIHSVGVPETRYLMSYLSQVETSAAVAKPSLKATSILHRTPWAPPIATSAQGIYVTTDDGRQLIDAVGGAAVACIGNGHPAVTKALKEQVDKISYVYNMQLSNEPAEELAKLLIEQSSGAFDLVGFVSGGSEAMEGVIKTARQYFFETKQPQRAQFIARHLSYHGNSIGTLSLAHHPARRSPYEAILDHEHFHHVSPAYAKRFQKPDETEEQYVERLRQELEDKSLELGPDTVIGFVAETVVGATTGVVPAPKGYFKAMKSVCDKYGALLILDEVMCGMGRMGTLHGWQSFGDNVAPDLQAVAKGLGGGYASIGAVLLSKKVADGIRDASGFWMHGHTYQANPLACAASLAVQKVIIEENLLENARVQGEYLGSLLRERLQSPNAFAAPFVFDVRGGGAWWGVEFDFTGPEASRIDFKGKSFGALTQTRCMEKGLIIMGMSGGANVEGTAGDHLMLSPAYNVTPEQVKKIADIFVEAIEEVLRDSTV